MTAPMIPFYNVVGFMIDGQQAYYGSIEVNNDIVVKPIYAPK